MHVATNPDVVVVGAGILGLASAYHILQADSSLNLWILDRLPGPGRGTTARSAAAYRDMFATPVNRHLAHGSLTFYENLQESGVQLDLLRLGYLWLRTAAQMASYGPNGSSTSAISISTARLPAPWWGCNPSAVSSCRGPMPRPAAPTTCGCFWR
jgi:glycine/D-amino acid oxidase-like deaminating enzyme